MTLLSNNEPVMEVMVLVIVCGQDAGIINLRKAGLLTLQVLRPEYSRITRPMPNTIPANALAPSLPGH